ncbi:MAG: phosphatase PAP2 family protein [Candidatus Kapaibacterium sp.]|nr:phosphatase PAP2 family protein [Ignavibacteriota bacterium]MCB9221131.1 phosphatase PAP2 family protein [Ignavibacteria bacterium]
MNELIEIDKVIFEFINTGLANPVTDSIMPIITEFKTWLPIYLLGMFYLLYRYRLKGVYLLLVLLLTVGFCDLINAQILKEYFARVRPCRALENVNLLVNCGAGLSFPSNHAVNNFAAATVLSSYFMRKRTVFFFIATMVSISRVFVGVHYLSDITAGAVEGVIVGSIIVLIFRKFNFDKEVTESIRIN